MSQARQRLAVIVPAFMEEREVEESLKRLLTVLDTVDMAATVTVVVDGSPDATEERVRRISDSRLSVISYAQNQGKGYALKHGCLASMNEADFVCFADADLDLNPSAIPSLLAILQLDGADAVVGSKTHPNSILSYPWMRRVQSSVFRVIIRRMFDLNVSDTQTGLKVFRRELLSACLESVESKGFAFDLELLALARIHGFTVVEGPIELTYNFSTTTGLRAVGQVLGDIWKIKGRLRGARATSK